MTSLFRSRKDKTNKTLPATPSKDAQATTPNGKGQVRFSEFGAVANITPRTIPAKHSQPLTPPESPLAISQPLPPPKYSFCPTQVPLHVNTLNSIDSFNYSADDVRDLKAYGFLAEVGSRITLGLGEVGWVIKNVGDELEQRGLATPLLFSNQALELNQTRTRMLIQSFIETLSSNDCMRTRLNAFIHDIRFAKEHELAWFLRWALSRITRVKENAKTICHGVMEWEVYEEWRGRERAANYPADAFPFLAQLIPPDVYNLILTPLFHLFSRFVAHSHLSGLTPHALSSLFAPLLFDSPTSTTALTSHAVFVRSACATEHLLLACIRSSDTIGTLVTDLPFRLKEWVAGYPSMVVPDADLARGAPRRGARIIRCERASRTVRAYTKDLLPHVEGWVGEVPDGEKWEAWERIAWKARRGSVARPKPSSAWKRRLAVKNIPTPPSHPSDLSRSVSYGAALRPASIMSGMGIKGREEEEEARYGSLAGKEWSMFEEGGFDAPTEEKREDIDMRLQFDLNESAKLSIAEKRQTMDWNEFAAPSGGFNRTDPLLDVSLSFSPPISSTIASWPKERDQLAKRLHKAQKDAVPFHYDTLPVFGRDVPFPNDDDRMSLGGRAGGMEQVDGKGGVYVEEAWIDVWADLMLGAGWVDREELTFREANWAIVEYKAKPSKMDPDAILDPMTDPRTSGLYILYEERVPLDYQLAIADPKEKKSFTSSFFSPKSKKRAPPTPSSLTRPTSGNGSGSSPKPGGAVAPGWQDSDFERMLLHRQGTKKVSLSKSRNDQPNSTVWHLFADPDPYPIFPLPLRTQTAARGSPMKSPSKMRGIGEKGNFSSAGVKSLGRVKSLEKASSSQHQNRNQRLFSGSSCSGNGAIPTESSDFLSKSLNKKKEKEKKKEKQEEQDIEFELHSASGVSSTKTSLRDGQDLGGIANGNGKEKWGEEKWMDILVTNGRRISGQDAPPPMFENKQTALHPNVTANASTAIDGDGAAPYVFAFALEPSAAPLRPISYENHPQPLSEPQLQGHAQLPIQAATSTSTSPPQSTSIITLTSPNSSLLLSEEDGTLTPRASYELSAGQRSIRLKSVPSVVDLDQSHLDEERKGGEVGFFKRKEVELSPSPAYVTAPMTVTEELPANVSPNVLSTSVGHEHGCHPPPMPEKNDPSYFDIPPQIHAPTPRRERDTIHGIVAQYAESHRDIVDEGRGSQDSRGTYGTYLRERKSADSARSSSYGGAMDNEAGQNNDFFGNHDEYEDGETDRDRETGTEGEEKGDEVLRPPAPEMIFDLTPGREPSPARYKHGEPLHFVGEEPEEEELY
ncbi:hypothetical protein C356_03199 [Cryptococcus neoformans c45]|nr:hypothetical protein C356_03199 [Cryptococcus neoformans var. grubii c45]